jgi:hypothetical protein
VKHIEIQAKWLGERHRFGETIIGCVHLDEHSLKLLEDGSSHMLTVKGPLLSQELELRQWYRFFGKWTKYKNKRTGVTETQFEFSTFVEARIHDKDGVVAYLTKYGTGNGVGTVTAGKLFDLYGADTLREIRENPMCIRNVSRVVTEDQCRTIQAALVRNQGIEDATVEITNLLAGRRFPKMVPQLSIQTWGNRAALEIHKDPYQLMGFQGVGFGLADRLYIDLGRRPNRIRRQLYCLSELLQKDNEGHVWFPQQVGEAKLKQTFGSATKFARVLELGNEYAIAAGEGRTKSKAGISTTTSNQSTGPLDDFGSFKWISSTTEANIEEDLADLICSASMERQPGGRLTKYSQFAIDEQTVVDHATCRRCGRQLTADRVHVLDGVPYGPTCIQYVDSYGRSEAHSLADWLDGRVEVKSFIDSLPNGVLDFQSISLWPEVDQIADIDDHQKQILNQSLLGVVALLGGRPGTGKTFAVARLIKALVEFGRVRLDEIGIGCPTGKAAVRLTEVMQAAGLEVRARTWHSLIAQAERNGGWHYKLLIGDESSMIDQALMLRIFQLRPTFCHVLLVGDVNQLPPVGRGAPFRDMIASGLPYGELTEIKRNSGGIVEACAAIVDGKQWTAGDNLKILHSEAAADSLEYVEAVINRMATDNPGSDPVWDCQVLIAVNEKSELSKVEVNRFLQQKLNSSPKSHHGTFCIGDKIVNTKNGYYQEVSFAAEEDRTTDGEVYVANGELGRIIEIEQNFFLVELQSPVRLVRVPFGRQSSSSDDSDDEEKSTTGCNWDLGYAISCHRSQGSEWPWVIVLIDDYPGAKMVCSREWLNTAISRAKKHCSLIGKKSVADQFCRRQAIGIRKTFLRELIGMKLAQRMLMEV